jgi:methylmalonyl-CoA mutase N-terminal domain/subunit
MEYITKIDKMGGALKAIEAGYIQKEVAESAYHFQRMIESDEHIVVGVNKFMADVGDGDEIEPENSEIAMETEMEQIERLIRLKQERDNQKVNEALAKVRDVANSNENIMPVLIDAVKTYATVGEISDIFREVFGEYRVPNIL